MNTHILAIGTLGNMEMLVIAVLILVLFGAKKLPTFARSLGRSMGEFKKARDEFESELHRATEETVNAPAPAIRAPAAAPAPQPAPVAAAVARETDHHEA